MFVTQLSLTDFGNYTQASVDLAARDPRLLHRARALVVLQRSGAITAFLADTLGRRVPPSVAGVQTALVELYAAHLPAVTPPAADLSLTFKYDVHAEITRLWAAYVDDLTQFRARVENRYPPADNPGLLQRPHPAPAGIR